MGRGGFLVYFLSGAMPRIAMFAILFLLARLLPLEQTGLFALVVTVGEMLEMTLCNWVRLFILNRESGRARITSLRAGRLILLGAATMLVAALLAWPAALVVVKSDVARFAVSVAIYVLAFGILRYVLTVLQATGRHGAFAAVELARGIAILVAVPLAAWMQPGSFYAPSLVLSLATLAVTVGGVLVCREVVARATFGRRGIAAALAFGAPVMADSILGFIVVYFERFVLNQFLGPASVGIYAIAYTLGRQPVDFLVGPINNLAVPVLFAARANEGEEAARAIQTGLATTMFILCAGVFTGLTLLADPLVRLLLSEPFWADTARLLPIITAAACLMVLKVFLFDNVFHMLAANRLKLPVVTVAAVAGMGLCVLLVRSWGLYGAAWSLLVSNTLVLLASVHASRKIFRFPIPFARFGMIALAAAAGGAALWFAAALAAPYGHLARIVAGSLAFCVVYAVALTLQGISLKSIAARPWQPFGAR